MTGMSMGRAAGRTVRHCCTAWRGGRRRRSRRRGSRHPVRMGGVWPNAVVWVMRSRVSSGKLATLGCAGGGHVARRVGTATDRCVT